MLNEERSRDQDFVQAGERTAQHPAAIFLSKGVQREDGTALSLRMCKGKRQRSPTITRRALTGHNEKILCHESEWL